MHMPFERRMMTQSSQSAFNPFARHTVSTLSADGAAAYAEGSSLLADGAAIPAVAADRKSAYAWQIERVRIAVRNGVQLQKDVNRLADMLPWPDVVELQRDTQQLELRKAIALLNLKLWDRLMGAILSLLQYGKGSGKGSSSETPIPQNPGNQRHTVSPVPAPRGKMQMEKGKHKRPLRTCLPAGAYYYSDD